MSKQQDAVRVFDGIVKLLGQFIEKIDGDTITQQLYVEYHAEGKAIVEAYNQEVEKYMALCQAEVAYLPTIEMIHEIQHLICYAGSLLRKQKVRVDDVARGKLVMDEYMREPRKPGSSRTVN